MPRSVNNVASKKRKKKILKSTKGFFGRRKNVWTVAKNALEKALLYSYAHRKTKKRNATVKRYDVFTILSGRSH